MLKKGGVPPRGFPNGAPPRGPPPASLMAKAKARAPPPMPTKGATPPSASSIGGAISGGATAKEIVAKIPSGKKKVKEYVHTIGLQLETTKAAHATLEDELKKTKRERDELREDFDALNDDFQQVRTDVAKAEKKTDEHLKNVKEMHGDNKEILESNEALRQLATIGFKGLIEIETTLVIAAGGIKTKGKKIIDPQEMENRQINAVISLKNVRNLKIKLRESLLAMSVDIFSQEEKDLMELVKGAGDEASSAATKIQSKYRGKQAKAEYEEKKEAATRVQCQIRGAQTRKKAVTAANEKEQSFTDEKTLARTSKKELVVAKRRKGKKEDKTVAILEDGKNNAVTSRTLVKSKKKIEELQSTVQKQKKELEILRKDVAKMKRAVGGGDGGKEREERESTGDSLFKFVDEESQKEADIAATKVQSHIRRKQTQKDFDEKKDSLKYEKDRDSLVRKARRAEALETEVKRLRDKLVETTMALDGALDRGRKDAREEYEKELARRERTSGGGGNGSRSDGGGGGGDGVDISMFEATAQELDMAQTKLAQTRSDLEQERKRNMRLHRLRMAAEEEIEKAKETLNIMSQETERERERSQE